MNAWVDAVKRSGQLVVSAGALAGAWSSVFTESLRDFNALSRTHRLGVTLNQGEQASVVVATADGEISATYDGVTRIGTLDGRIMHGRTLQFSRDDRIEKAFVFLPTAPRINTPRGQRPVGAGVLKVICVHELVHACGLTNTEHTQDDLFQANPQVDPGTTATQDRVRIQTRTRTSTMPPLVLGAETVRRIKELWG